MEARHDAEGVRRVALGCVGALSVANGLFDVTFGSRVPGLIAQLGLTVGVMGFVLAAFSVGLVAGGAVVSYLAGRRGTRVPLLLSTPLCFAPLVAIGFALYGGWLAGPAGALVLAVLWGVAGFGCGILDPAHAIAVNNLGGARLVHAFLAIKMLATAVGALVGSVLIAHGVSVADHFVAIGILTLVTGVGSSYLLPAFYNLDTAADVGPDVGRWGLVALGLLVGAAVVPLGGALNWGTKMLEDLGAPDTLVGSGVVGFAAAQMLGMLAARRLGRRIRPMVVAMGGLALAAAGVATLALVALGQQGGFLPLGSAIWLSVGGFVALGLGIAPIPGYVQSAAHSVRASGVRSNTRLSLVTMQQFGWQALGPVMIGLLGARVGVSWAFVLVCGACVVVILLGRRLLRHANAA